MLAGDNDDFRLEVRLDGSGIEEFEPDQALKVLAVDSRGRTRETTARLDVRGQGAATLHFGETPPDLWVLIGPEHASAEQLLGLDTLRIEVPARRWAGARGLTLAPIAISTGHWRWWCRWRLRKKNVCRPQGCVPVSPGRARDVHGAPDES